MPFIGKDWRAPGETWIRVNHTSGWERIKLRPVQLFLCPSSNSSEESINSSPVLHSSIYIPNCDDSLGIICSEQKPKSCNFHRQESSISLFSNEENSSNNRSSFYVSTSPSTAKCFNNFVTRPELDDCCFENNEERKWIPHCFVKTTRSKEFIGCTSISEAFHRLDIARAVVDVRRFNYICKVVQILVHEKLQNLSATARKHLFAIIQSIVLHSVEQDVHLTTARDLLNGFSAALEERHVYGSPQIVSRQLDSVLGLVEMIVDRKPTTLSDSSEESLTFLDLPREIISLILCRLPDHVSILETAKAHETLNALIEREVRVWQSLCCFNFSDEQIKKHRTSDDMPWRQVFFQLKKYYGLREVYADLIHICCHCKALFWKDHGHPCVSKEAAPSVRVTPRQFVDMLLFL